MNPDRNKIIKFMQSTAKKPMSFRELSISFEISKKGRNSFKRLIFEMVENGELVKIRGGRYGLPSKMSIITGRLISHPDGYGFVVPDEEGEDIYIRRGRLRDAMHSDRVTVRIEGTKPDGKREGGIIKVIERAHKTLVGKLEKLRGGAFVIPSEERILYDIVVPVNQTMKAKGGELVTVEITRWPSKRAAPMGRVIEVLGDPEDPDVEAELITRKFGLVLKFPNTVQEAAEKIASTVQEEDTLGRTDLRDKVLFTIDGETAKDFDDAVGIERLKDGFKLYVSIADVSHYVTKGSVLDHEAYARATSTYFPDRCIPMLPERLSNGICSLNPNVDRLTLTAEMRFDDSGNQLSKKIYESVIKSKYRLTYTKVKDLLDGVAYAKKELAEIEEEIKCMEELAKKLMAKRNESGSLDFDLPEPQMIINIEGKVEDIVKGERNIAHRIIEEFMLAANRSVAEEFEKRELPSLYRVHDAPESDRLEDFRAFASTFGLHLKGNNPKAFQTILKKVDGLPEERLINHVLLRSLKQAVYSDINTGHFGLAFDNYTHFTSPIRRYPDLIVHRLTRELIHNSYTKKLKDRMSEELAPIAAHSSERERNSMQAEREITDLKKAQFMEDKIGQEFDGFISGVTGFGFFVELKDYFIEGLVHVTSLLDDYYTYDEKRHSLIGDATGKSYTLGSAVRVMVDRVDLERRRIDLELIEEGTKIKKRTRKRAKRK